MTTDRPISVGIFAGFSWIRCDGKGSFLNSPALKHFGDKRIAAGEKCLVVDLEGCTGMDSTFMGTLAGMASRITANDGAVLQIAGAGSRNRRSLEDLGLDFMMEIDPPAAPWRDQLANIREALDSPEKVTAIGNVQRTQLVLEAHQTLSEVNEKNAATFSNVVTMLETELAEKQKLAQGKET